MPRRPSTDQGATLTPLMFWVLVAVTARDQHGYAILQEIEGRTGGAFRVGAGSLYRAVRSLLDAGLIVEVQPEERTHRQRRYYGATPAGRRRAATEALIFRDMVAWAEDVGVLSR